MQKGKRYRGGLDRTAMMVVLAFALSRGECRAADSWQRAMGGVIFPRRRHPAVYGATEGYLLAAASAANPFAIPGLCESTAFLSLVRNRCSAGLEWERTGIAGYSHDLLEVSGGFALPGGFIHAAASMRAESWNVTGYGRDTSVSVLYSLSMKLSSIAVIELEGGGRQIEAPAHITVAAGRGTAVIILTYGRDGYGGKVARAGGTVSITGRFSFLAGYDMDTGEASGGLAFRTRVLAAISWSIHPALGPTFSVSAGAVR